MHTTNIITGFLSCLLVLFTLTHSFAVLGKTVDDEHLSLIGHPSGVLPNQFIRIYQDDSSAMDHSDEHDMEKRRFNAWAGKRNVEAKRRFNAWAGRR